jgi:DNA-binding SARP family transcriptional activator
MKHSRRRRSLAQGLSALVKSSMLAFGVPVAIERLWVVAGSLRGTAPVFSDTIWIRGVLVVVAFLWCRVLMQLILDLRSALHGTPLSPLDWSSRWATSIAALAILASAGHVAGGHAHKTPASISVAHHHTPPSNQHGATIAGQLRPGECLADIAARVLSEPEQWSVLAAANMGRLLGPEERFVDPSLVRSDWCLALPLTAATPSNDFTAVPHRSGGHNVLEELEWLSLGVLGTAALIRRLRALRISARAARYQGERITQRDIEIEALEARLDPFGDAVLIDWIEAANRLLRVTANELGIAPVVQLVRAGPSGVTFYFESAEPLQSDQFVVGDGGFSWTLSLRTPLERVIARTSGVGRYAPWLIPVGDDGEDAWLVAVGPAQSLAIDCDETTEAEVLRGITTALRTLPWAEELSVELLGLEPPPVAENCYQMAASSIAALVDLAADPPSARAGEPPATWRREPLIVTRSSDVASPLPERVTATAGVIRPGKQGSICLCIDKHGARLVPIGVSLNVPRPNDEANSLIERLLARAASIPLLTVLPTATKRADRDHQPLHRSRHVVQLRLLGEQPSASGLTEEVSDRDRPRVVELLSFLALHGGLATQLEIMTALFPRAGSDAHRRLDTVLVATRRALGSQQLVVAGNGMVTVDATLRSDWVDLLEELARARTEEAASALTSLARVLDGPPWRPGVPFRWMLTEGLIDHLCFEICDAMHQLAALASAGGDLELAGRSIRAGLEVEPTSELLVRDLMVLRSQLDGTPGLIEAYAALESALGEIGGVEPSWATRALFDELAGDQT